MVPDPSEKWAKIPKVADSTLQNLASDYLTISRVASNTEALNVVIFPPPEYRPKTITDLKRIANNIVALDLSRLPIGRPEIDVIATFANLERLELDKTPVTDADVEKLASLEKLELLKIYDTKITDQSIPVFKKLPNLKSLYLYKTEVSENAVASLKKEKPKLLINDGIDKETQAFFVATDSVINNQ